MIPSTNLDSFYTHLDSIARKNGGCSITYKHIVSQYCYDRKEEVKQIAQSLLETLTNPTQSLFDAYSTDGKLGGTKYLALGFFVKTSINETISYKPTHMTKINGKDIAYNISNIILLTPFMCSQ